MPTGKAATSPAMGQNWTSARDSMRCPASDPFWGYPVIRMFEHRMFAKKEQQPVQGDHMYSQTPMIPHPYYDWDNPAHSTHDACPTHHDMSSGDTVRDRSPP
jgi:hypothetical protein